MRIAILAALVLVAVASSAAANCGVILSTHCETTKEKPAPANSWPIRNESRQQLGDVYNPGNGRRLQIRDNSRRIRGYIESDGTITNPSRQPVGSIELDD